MKIIDPMLAFAVDVLFGLECVVRLARVKLNALRARRVLRRLDGRLRDLDAAARAANFSSVRFACALRNLGATIKEAGPCDPDSARLSPSVTLQHHTKR